MDFAVPVDYRIKVKECEKKNTYFDLARELKKLWNIKVTFIQIVIGALGTVTKGLVKGLEDLEIRGRMETTRTIVFLNRLEYWVESWKLEKTCSHSNSSKRPSANADVKNFQGVT